MKTLCKCFYVSIRSNYTLFGTQTVDGAFSKSKSSKKLLAIRARASGTECLLILLELVCFVQSSTTSNNFHIGGGDFWGYCPEEGCQQDAEQEEKVVDVVVESQVEE